MLFLNKLYDNCQQHADKIALEFIHPDQTETVTYGQLEHTIQRTIAYLQALGVQPGDRVALQLNKGLPFIYLHLAILRMGAITLPLNPAYPPGELAYFLNDSGARLLFTDVNDRYAFDTLEQIIYFSTDFVHLLPDSCAAPDLPADPDMTAVMLYTSGTTGRSKGAQITHRNLTANIDALHEAWGWQEDDILLHVLPIFHVHGLVVALHGALNAGATTILLPKFDPQQTLNLLVTRRCTVFMAVPTIHKRLLDAPGTCDLSHMRLLTSGSDRLPDDVFLGFREKFGHTLLERYGMTETGMNLSNPLHGERRVGSVGLPLPGVEARIVHPETGEPLPDGTVGEVQIRGPHVFKGYWNQPEKTAEAFTEDGWLKTGDLGVREADGYFTLKGRAKDLIITGGLNVYPPEVELVLAEHPAVGACAVIGCPDDEWGETVVAIIIPQGDITEAALIRHCREKLAAYKAPRRVIFVDEFPRNALGKIQKAQLRQNLCD